MIYLIGAVLVMVFNATVLKWGESQHQDRIVVMWVNYLVATTIAALLWGLRYPVQPQPLTVWLGLLAGAFYALGLFISMGAIQKAGVAVYSAVARMAVLWPILVSIVLFAEVPTGVETAGIVLAFTSVALLLANSRPRGLKLRETAVLWLAGNFINGGLVGIIQKLFTEYSEPADKPAMVCVLFVSATVVSGVPFLVRRYRFLRLDVLRGVLFGTGNVAASSLLFEGLAVVPGVIAFPFVSIGVILLASLSGVVMFHEQPGPLGYVALTLAAVAILLMNL